MKTLDQQTKNKIISLIHALQPNARIYLYGSRARGTNAPFSDIDLAIDTGEKLPIIELGEIKSVLEGSNIMYKVDVVDYHHINKEMKNSIDSEKIIWKN
jgi:predicted nucleotidyltransferase